MSLQAASIAPQEVARFSAHAQEWWNPNGAFRALHELGPLRLAYVRAQIAAHCQKRKGLRVCDLGCGGGLMAEMLAREGYAVTGIDASAEAISVAKDHAQAGSLKIDYRQTSAEALAASGEKFDVITTLEIVEHVRDLKSFMKAVSDLLAPGGIVIVATLNRTKRSYLLAVLGAEYILGWVPPGTHDWDKFVKPSELQALWTGLGIEAADITGMVFKPFLRRFELAPGNAAVNYFMTGQKT